MNDENKEEKDSSIREELKKMNDNFEKIITLAESKKIKGLKIVKPKKMGRSTRKKGFVNYVYIRENGTMDTIKVPPIQEGTTVAEEVPRLATPEYVLNWKGVPTVIQPSWSTRPFSPIQSFADDAKANMLAAGWRLLTNRAESGDIKPKKKISGIVIFLIIAAVLVAGYFLLKK